jgi:hypothetical protein
MTLFIRRFSKMMGKQKFFKGEKKDKFRSKTKRACYNCGKYGHYIANCPHECREEVDDNHYKKKSYGEAHIGKEWDSGDESSNSDSDDVATVAIKGSTFFQANLSSPTSTKGNILAS